MSEPIAILGMGCRYPQADGLGAFWKLLVEGRDAIAPYPGGRFRELDAEYAKAAEGHGKLATHLGGFLPEIDKFDAAFFGISPREAAYVDPQQRLLLEVSWDALEDAGQLREKYEGTRTGVYTGLWTTEYEQLTYRMAPKPEFYMLTGGGRSTACGRVSFTFGFEGPSVSVDTACSSSMVAIHMACQALRNGECEMALAGGVNVIVSADQTWLFTHAGMLAKDAHCKFGDEGANGFVRSEGAGMVVLKRLSDALAAGDPIYAVIRGSAVNNDGRSGGLMVTPSREGQKAMLLGAWSEAGIGADEIGYIEAHGTGTHAGDPVEIGAIGDALQVAGAVERVPLGSVKTNIGHTESAAGVAGVIKAALVLHEGVIPPSLNFTTPNSEIDWDGKPLEIVTAKRALPARADGRTRYVGASSFGLTGTNAHMLLGEFAQAAVRVDEAAGSLLLPITAYSAESLKENARRWIEYLDRDWTRADLAEACYLAGARRTPLQQRFAAVGADAAELRLQLEAFLNGDASASPEAGVANEVAARVVFVTPGQGSQWDGMARELLAESAAFRESFTACDKAIATETGWSLIERLESADAARYLTEIDFVQPALFAMSVALAAVWRAAGVEPGVVVGHSMGEAAAAYISGALSLEDAAAVICRRSRLMRRLSGSGSMASVEMPPVELAEWLGQFDGRVSVAAENSPGTTVVSGESEAVDQLLEWLELKEVFCRRIKVDVASHSVMVDPILAELALALADLKPRTGKVPFFSTVNGAYIDGAELNAAYWVRNLREPVQLATATGALLSEGFNAFVELSPHPIVVPALENTLRRTADGQAKQNAVALPSLVRGGAAWPALLRSLGRFWIVGGKLNWGALTGRGDGPVTHQLRLPEYAFERERFWMEEADEAEMASAAKLSPLLRSRTDLAHEPGTTIFRVIADLKALPYVADHRVGGAAVFPGAGHLEVVLEAARVLWPEKPARITDVEFLQALYLSEGDTPEVQLTVRRVPGSRESSMFSLLSRASSGAGAWTEHSRGMIWPEDAGAVISELAEAPDFAGDDLAERRATGEDLYRKAKRAGLDYGPAFQLVESFACKRLDGVLMAQTQMRGAEEAGEYLLHPATLDACFQTMVMMRSRVPGLLAEDVYLPSALGAMHVHMLPGSLPPEETKRLVTEAVFRRADAGLNALDFDLKLSTESGRLLATFQDFTIKRVESQAVERTAEDLYLLGWKPMRVPGEPTAGVAIGRHWLIFADGAKELAQSRAAELARRHTEHGGRCTLVWAGGVFRALGAGERRLDLLGADEYELPLGDISALDRLLGLAAAEAGQNGRFSDVVDLWTLEDGRSGTSRNVTLDAILGAQARGATFLPTLVQAITRAGWTQPPKLWMVTEGTQRVPEALTEIRLEGSTAWGMGAVLMREHPELRPCLVDLSSGAAGVEIEILMRLLLDEAPKAAVEERIALRGELAFAERALPCPLTMHRDVARPLMKGEAFRVETDRAGALDQLVLRTMVGGEPGPGEVAIEIAYGGINFVDVTKALGLYPGLDPRMPLRMGGEASGRIVAVGEGVTEFSVGDAVVAITPAHMRVSMLASRAVVPVALVTALPESMTLAEGAAQPLAYFTAHLALNELARLRKGEWVLVHSGSGGVGLAAAKIAQALGAKVIATASSPEKHAYLHAWGVEHVLNSRTLEFGDGVMEITGGRGVDVVLNSLTGDAINRSLEVLAPYGRFVELGKRDIYEDKRVGLKAFRKNLSYFVVDMAGLLEERREYAGEIFREVMATIGSGTWKALPVTEFPASRVAEVFRFMAQAKHVGKLVIGFAGARDEVQVLPAKLQGTPAQPSFDGNASYILTGGLGGVGLAVTEWMAANRAGCLVLVSRREPGAEERAAIERARALGARIEHRRTDLTDRSQVGALIAEIEATMPPLKGILHAAAVIDDALVTDLRPERFDAVFAPKIRGAWYLHEATLGLPLEFFVMFSSVATIFPQPGHGSYAAANSFLDAFAGYRRGLGLAASSIDWTGWVGLGLARNMGTSRTIEACAAEGLGSFDYVEATAALGQALWADPIHATAVRVEDQVVLGLDAVPTLLRELVGEGVRAGATVKHPLLVELAGAASYGERMGLLETLLRTETSRVLKLAPEKIGANQAFGQMGIDSLMALELIRRVNAALGLALPATAVFNYPTITVLSGQILKRLVMDASAAVAAAPVAEERRTEIDELSEDEALRALMEPGDSSGGD